MKQYIFKISLWVMLLVFPVVAGAQETKYEQRVTNRQQKWSSLTPRYTKIQFAGSMGLVSAGTGWKYGKNERNETDLLLGFVPKYSSDESHLTLTLKQNLIPWNVKLGTKGFAFEPLATGIYLNTIFGEHFWSKQPERYPGKYYGFTTKFRFNVYVGQRLEYVVPETKRHFAKSYALFYEISTCDLYIIDAVNNKCLTPADYLHLSFGVKIQLF